MYYINKLIRNIMYLVVSLITKHGNKEVVGWAMCHFSEYHARYLHVVWRTKWPTPEDIAAQKWLDDHPNEIIFK